MTYGGGEIWDGNNDNGSGIRGEDMYRDNREEIVLISLSDLYLELEAILVSASRPSSCPTLYYLLTTSITNYCLK